MTGWWRTVAWVGMMASSAAHAGPTPNGSSFLDAGKSRIDYTKVSRQQPKASCQSLAAVADSDHSVLSAIRVPASPDSPEMCVVRGVLSPEIQYIVYLPTGWNGRFYMNGNGGFAGEPLDGKAAHVARLKAARHGFAAAFTNTGHDAEAEPGSDWGYKNLQKEIDFAFRSVHLTAVTAKKLAAEYYGAAPSYSYFDGCSTGGYQGFSEAQRFPDDFDGILAGAPVFNMNEMFWQYWQNQRAVETNPISREKLDLLGKFILERFDGVDGVKDGVIGNPAAIDFDPERDLPRDTDAGAGFTEAEIQTLETIYGPVYSGDELIFPRTVIGGEFPGVSYAEGSYEPAAPVSAWEGRVVPDTNGKIGQQMILQTWFQNLAFEVDDPELDWRTLSPEKDRPRTEQAGLIFDATNPDLSSFHQSAGKMIVYHGWADFGINPMRTIEYFDEVNALLGKETETFLQLYLIPGMQHCDGGANVDRFDLMTPLINWVEGDVAPRGLVGHRVEGGKVTRSRPLCAHPAVAQYRGSGDPDAAESFACVAPAAVTGPAGE